MGLAIKDIIVRKEISISDLKGKILVVDALNVLYQYLTSIRGPDGAVLTGNNGIVTSHLIGLFSRTTSLMESGLKLAFVFDGKPPEIKRKTMEIRKSIKVEASRQLKEAEEAGDEVSMKKFAARTARLTKEMIQDAIKLIKSLGLPVIQAPSEGEAQATYMVKQGDAYATVSQDYDNLIFGCPILVRNLSIAGKRKKTGTLGFITVKPEVILLQDVLGELKLTNDQLIVLAILVGTDYNPGGVKGIGPKKGLKLVQEHKDDYEKIFAEAKWGEFYPDLEWKEIYDTIKDIPVTDDYELEWKNLNEREVRTLLIEEFGFGSERVNNKLEKLSKMKEQISQKGLSSFF
jgi:flap endonuclease-1